MNDERSFRALVERLMATDDKPAIDRVGPKDAIHDRAYDLIGDMGNIVPPVRKQIRDALDKADAPDKGRAKSDGALGRVTR